MDLSFEVFLERISTEKKKYECEYSTGEIVLRTEDRERVIATHIPVIEYPNMIQCDEDVINFELHFCLEEKENRKAELEIIVYGLEQHRVEAEREEVEKLINILYKEKWVENRSILTDLFVGYIKFFVRGYLETHYYFLTRCGWKKVGNGREFYSVTKRRGGDFKYIQEMFGEEIYQMYKRGEEFSHILNYFNQCKEFYDLLFENPILIGIFAYTIHALIWDFGCTYEEENYYACTDYVENKDTLFFSICIHGKDIDKAKVIANILCNLFNEPKDSWTVISRLHHVSATSCIPYKDKLNKYSSVPIVVTSKNNHLVKSAKAVTELCRYRKNMKLFIYPVYINDALINVDEMVNFNIDVVRLPLSVKDKEMAHKIHNQMTMLLFSFVWFLRNNSMEWRRDSAQGETKRNLMNAMEGVEQEWVEKNLPKFLLFAALKAFCDFLNLYQKDVGDKLLSAYRDSVINIEQMESDNQQTQKKQSDAEQEQRYLLCLHELITDALKKKETWLNVGNEPRDSRERCYYLDSEWYDRFCAKIKKEKIEAVTKRKIMASLKSYQILKRPKSGSANVMWRNKKYCYVILADVLTDKVNSWNTLPE